MELGLLTGAGLRRRLTLRAARPARRRCQAGDRLVTFGSQDGKPYVPGVPVGVVAVGHAHARAR